MFFLSSLSSSTHLPKLLSTTITGGGCITIAGSLFPSFLKSEILFSMSLIFVLGGSFLLCLSLGANIPIISRNCLATYPAMSKSPIPKSPILRGTHILSSLKSKAPLSKTWLRENAFAS